MSPISLKVTRSLAASYMIVFLLKNVQLMTSAKLTKINVESGKRAMCLKVQHIEVDAVFRSEMVISK